MPPSIAKFATIAGFGLAFSACLLNTAGSPEWVDEFENEFGTENAPELTLEVRNDNFYDATLYAHGSGYKERLGVVNSYSSSTFRFRWPVLDLQIEIDLLSVGSVFTHQMPVDQGETLQLVIEPDAHRRARR